MLLTVYDSNRQAKAVLSPDDSSTQVKAIQSDNVLTLSFTLYEYVALEVNDYVDFEGERSGSRNGTCRTNAARRSGNTT